MERWRAGHSLAVLVISYCWLAADHPDPKGHTLKTIGFVLRSFAEHAKRKYGDDCKVGVFWDYMSLPQRSRECPHGEDDRTGPEMEVFRMGLHHINTWYAHPKTYVLLVNGALPEDAISSQPYDGRGWCCAERAMASMVKSTYCLLDMSKLDGTETDCNDLVIKAAADRSTTVVAPPAFRTWLLKGVDAGEIKFTKPTDAALVADIYAKAFQSEFTIVHEMRYDQTGMGDADACALAESITHAHGLGALHKLQMLDVSFNKIGDAGCAAIAHALSEGAMPSLTSLRLRGNGIGDEGMAALAQALASAVVTHTALRDIRISGNPASESAQESVQAATSANVFIGTTPVAEAPSDDKPVGGETSALVQQGDSQQPFEGKGFISEINAAVRASIALPASERAAFIGSYLKAAAEGTPLPTPAAGGKTFDRAVLREEMRELGEVLTNDQAR